MKHVATEEGVVEATEAEAVVAAAGGRGNQLPLEGFFAFLGFRVQL